MASFGPVAEFYDELMQPVPYRMWASYYLLLLAQQDCRPKRVLDVACGTGKLSELLAQEGLEITGIDISEPMIDRARKRASQLSLPLRFEVADAAEFVLNEEFDGACSFFDSLNYITEPERLQSAFSHIANHLISGGSLVFDLNTAYAFEQGMFDQKEHKKNAKVRYDWKSHWDAASRIVRVEMKFWWDGREFEEVHTQRAYSDEEIREMLRRAGFFQVQRYHSYTLDRARANSDRVHYTAVRL